RRVGRLVVDLIADHLTKLPDAPAFRPVPPGHAEALVSMPAPQDPVSPDDMLLRFKQAIEPYPFGNGHPRFWGWVNSPPAVMGIFAEALAAAMNPSCAGGNHAAIYVEHAVLAWFRDLLGFPAESAGLLVSGGSMATMTALAVARHMKSGVDVRADGLRNAPSPFAFYMSTEAHSCARKAIELLGFGSASVRTIPTDAAFRMNVDALEAAIAGDVAGGARPIAAIATGGSTNTGAIDDLAAIAGVCRRHDVWMHVDAAYGGPAILSQEYAGALRAIAEADSVALDPHKWLFVPVEAGLVLVRDASAMRSAFSLVPPYIRQSGSAGDVYGVPWFSEYGFQQTRGFRALKVWMTLQQFGLTGLTAAIEDNLALAAYLADHVRASPDLELMAPPALSIVCFRFVGTGAARDDHGSTGQARVDEEAIAALNRVLLERLQLGGEAFLTSTELRGRYTLRACFVNYRSRRKDVDRMLTAVRTLGHDITQHSD
ncbi:MAG: pyridoxal-dependent decarboxylase, partial [Acidobacteria bacterium]|nr:pyridoxal-dependent decarboxylase [Acidobacteriota bacterium]